MTVLPLVLAAVAMFPIRLERANTPTSLPLVEVASVLRIAHVEVFGRTPTRDRLRIAVGQVRLEGLNLGGKNLGGLEYVEGLPWVRLDRLTRLRAFDSYEAAARAYWALGEDLPRGVGGDGCGRPGVDGASAEALWVLRGACGALRDGAP